MALAVKDLTVSIGEKVILNKVSVKFPVGKITSVIGPNGAGKSTLLRAAAGITSGYGGKVMLDGTDIHAISRSKLAQQLAILPQGMGIPADITVKRLVDYGRFPYRSWLKHGNPQEDETAVQWAMEATHIQHLAKQQVFSLSGGERQRTWIAMALAQRPQILLLDEPTTYLDIAHQLEVLEIIRTINTKWNMTIIMVIHDLNQAGKYSDNLVVVKDKGIFTQGAPKEVLTKEFLAKVFGVQAELYVSAAGDVILNPIKVF